MTGLTGQVMKAIEADRRKKNDRTIPTIHYQAVAAMKDFNLTPGQWQRLSRFDRKVLHYHRIMEGYYFDRYMDAQKQRMEQEDRRRHFLDRLPRQQIRGRKRS